MIRSCSRGSMTYMNGLRLGVGRAVDDAPRRPPWPEIIPQHSLGRSAIAWATSSSREGTRRDLQTATRRSRCRASPRRRRRRSSRCRPTGTSSRRRRRSRRSCPRVMRSARARAQVWMTAPDETPGEDALLVGEPARHDDASRGWRPAASGRAGRGRGSAARSRRPGCAGRSPGRPGAARTRRSWISARCSLRRCERAHQRAAGARGPATKTSISGQSRTISSAVPS